MPGFARPRLVVSKCLGFAPCRYDGAIVHDDFTARLAGWVDFLPLCPELALGLGAPRPPVRLLEREGRVRLVQPQTGKDLTQAMVDLGRRLLDQAGSVDGCLLKSRSPSCGPLDVTIHREAGGAPRKGRGLFAQMVLEDQPLMAMEHEGRVRNQAIREHFLTKIFVLAELRQLGPSPAPARLMAFQARHKLLLMAYNQTAMRRLGRLLAQGTAPADLAGPYRQGLLAALAKAPGRPAAINALMHAQGYFKKGLAPAEKAYFMDLLEQYRAGRAPLSLPQGVLLAWVARFDERYLAGQSFFSPYPRELLDLADSGKGRPV